MKKITVKHIAKKLICETCPKLEQDMISNGQLFGHNFFARELSENEIGLIFHGMEIQADMDLLTERLKRWWPNVLCEEETYLFVNSIYPDVKRILRVYGVSIKEYQKLWQGMYEVQKGADHVGNQA